MASPLQWLRMLSPVLLLAREVDVAGRAVIATDANGSIIYWGNGAESLFGWTAEDAMGRNVLEVTPSAYSAEDADGIMRTLKAGDPWSGEFMLQTRQGKRFTAQVTDIPVHSKTGDLLGIVGISRRITYTSDFS